MTTTDGTDEEWERSEQALKNLQIEPKLPDQAIFFPSRTTDDEKKNSESNNIFEDGKGNEDQINSALINALQNPRERMNVLKYEDRILRFVKSSDSFLAVPPITNSYQRLLIYKVAQRFGLDHNASETSNEDGDRGIIFYKTSTTSIPSILLINYKGEEFKMESSLPASTPPPTTTAKAPKIVVMQRRNQNNSSSNQKSNNSNEKNQASALEREKAYAAARARIFGEDSSPDQTSSPSPPTARNVSESSNGNGNGNSSKQSNSSPSLRGGRSDSNSTMKSKKSPSPDVEIDEEKNLKDSNEGQKKKVVDPGAWKEKKVLLRDKQADRFDPDFARFHSGPAIAPTLSSSPYHISSPTPTMTTPTVSFTSPIPPVYPANMVLHQPPQTIASPLPSSPMIPSMQSWNPSPPLNMMNPSPPQWDRPQTSQPGFGTFDYQRNGFYPSNYSHGSMPLPPPAPSPCIPVAPGLPDHLIKTPSPNPTSYNKDFPPLA